MLSKLPPNRRMRRGGNPKQTDVPCTVERRACVDINQPKPHQHTAAAGECAQKLQQPRPDIVQACKNILTQTSTIDSTDNLRSLLGTTDNTKVSSSSTLYFTATLFSFSAH